MDLFQDEKIVRESYFYIIDFESHDKLFKNHKELDEPKIHYYYKRLLISDNLFHQDKHKSEVKNELDFDNKTGLVAEISKEVIEEKQDFEKAKNTMKREKFGVLVINHHWWKNSEEQKNQIKLFKSLMTDNYVDFKKFALIDYNQLNTHSDIKYLENHTILIYCQDQLLTNNYYCDKLFIFPLLSLCN